MKKEGRIEVSHRGLRTITGYSENDLRFSIVTSGMGHGSLEIVVNEMIALREIDLQTRTPIIPRPSPMHIIRLGTSGGLSASTELGTSIITAYAIGLDNTGIWCDAPDPSNGVCEEIERRVEAALMKAAVPGRWASKIKPYAAMGDPMVVQALTKAAEKMGAKHKVGITASASGFFANQGRVYHDRMKLTVPEVDHVVSEVKLDDITNGLKVENMEMETSALMHLGNAAGYRCGTVCVAVANRKLGTFLDSQVPVVEATARFTLAALEALDKQDP